MKKILLPLTLFVAAHTAFAGSKAGAAAPASDTQIAYAQAQTALSDGLTAERAAQMTPALLVQIQNTNLMILATLKKIEAKQDATPNPSPASRYPAVTYRLSGATGESWAPEGVWADETGIHVRLKDQSHGVSVADSILVEQQDGSYKPVGLRFWPVGIVDVEARSNHIVFRKANKEVTAAAIEH